MIKAGALTLLTPILQILRSKADGLDEIERESLVMDAIQYNTRHNNTMQYSIIQYYQGVVHNIAIHILILTDNGICRKIGSLQRDETESVTIVYIGQWSCK